MWKYFTHKNTRRYVDILPDLLKSYNHSFHRSIKIKPIEVNKANENVVLHTLYGEIISQPVRFLFNVGDSLRISKTKKFPYVKYTAFILYIIFLIITSFCYLCFHNKLKINRYSV